MENPGNKGTERDVLNGRVLRKTLPRNDLSK